MGTIELPPLRIADNVGCTIVGGETALSTRDDETYVDIQSVNGTLPGRLFADFAAVPDYDPTDESLVMQLVARVTAMAGDPGLILVMVGTDDPDFPLAGNGALHDQVQRVTYSSFFRQRLHDGATDTGGRPYLQNWRAPSTLRVSYAALRLTADSIGAVLTPVAASFTATPQDDGLGVGFDASLSGPNVVDYSWDFGDGATADVAVPVTAHAYADAGTYTVRLTVTSGTGTTDTETTQVEVGIPAIIGLRGPTRTRFYPL